VSELVPLEHPRFHTVDPDIFVKRLAPDCMSFECRLLKHDDRVKLDACCQYGVDTDLAEREGILSHRAEIHRLLREDARDLPWFSDTERVDPDFPSGRFVRTRTHGDGCIFLAHDRRGCAIHRASIDGGWDFRGIKPHVCRLFPLSYDEHSIVFSDDYQDYSCSAVPFAPSVYRVQRSDLGDIFGGDLVSALDAVEARVLSRRSLSLAG
jgi:hypothetical protein